MIPDAPWTLHGEAIAFLASPFCLRLAVNYHDSPVGPYLEHALAKMTARGPHIFQMSVTLDDSQRGGRAIWGFPKELEALRWAKSGARIEFQRRSTIFRVRTLGPRFPLALSFWTVQFRGEEPVRVPGRIAGRARLGFRGRQPALFLENFEMTIEPPQAL